VFPNAVQTSGQYNFNPSGGEIILTAFDRIQVRPTEITQQQVQRALLEMNLALVKFNNLQPNLWTVDLQAIPLIQGSATYSVPAETTMILDLFIRYGSPQIDRYLEPMSRTEYVSIASKTSQGFPSQYWFDRLQAPTVTFYPTPDGALAYTVYYYRVRQIEDATITNAYNIEVVYRFLDALVADLAHRLSRVYRPELEAIRKVDRDEAWMIAAAQDTENTPLYIAPQMGGYFR
jgi:hypothetical protein